MSKLKFAGFFMILIFATACTQGVAQNTKASFEIRDSDHVFGNPDAPITMFEYSDFECPYCRSFQTTAELIVNEFDGDVNWVYRHFPLGFHDPAATLEASAAECAADQGGDDKFYEFAELIYSRTSANGKGIDKDILVDMSEEAGLNKDEFEQCLDSDKFDELIKQSVKEGVNLGVTGTPATFVYDHRTGDSSLVSGNQTFDKLKKYLEGII
jgi:protein-disulfide isomerase